MRGFLDGDRHECTAEAARAAAPLKRHVAAVIVGNALEFYDFLTYSFFAIYIGQAFFPSANPASSLLPRWRPSARASPRGRSGGSSSASLGDRWGRKPAMFLSFIADGAVAMLGVVVHAGLRLHRHRRARSCCLSSG